MDRFTTNDASSTTRPIASTRQQERQGVAGKAEPGKTAKGPINETGTAAAWNE